MTVLTITPYIGVIVAAAVEGEVVFVAASALVASGYLHPIGVLLSGALGAALGDQVVFFAIRAGASRWLARAATDRPRDSLQIWVRRHQSIAAFAVRFVPGFRITLTALCATAGVSASRFCAANTASAFLWALVVMAAVAYGGPRVLSAAGLGPRVSATLIAVSALFILATLAPLLRRRLAAAPGLDAGEVALEP